MKVLVDTSIWSIALRRSSRAPRSDAASDLASLVADGRVAIIGAIRQELLSGVRESAQFERLRDHLRAFADTPLTVEDYEEAAAFYNRCRAKGIQGSNTDYLICAVAARHELPIFTADEDFVRFAKVLPISLYTSEA